VREAIIESKTGKAGGPTEVVVETISAYGEQGVKSMTQICNKVFQNCKALAD
jgi:hypothetical protein